MSELTPAKLQQIVEAAIMVAGQPVTLTQLQNLFPEDEKPTAAALKEVITSIQAHYQESGIELQEVASGYRFQAKGELSPWLAKLWEERPPRYSRAFLETLAIIAYKQPITRGEIEEIRGVTVSSTIVKTLMDREWVRIVGYREVPGRPAIFGTTKTFLDHFNLKSLAELPTLAEFKDIEAQEAKLQIQLALENSDVGPIDSEAIPAEAEAIITETEPDTAESDIISIEEEIIITEIITSEEEANVSSKENNENSEATT